MKFPTIEKLNKKLHSRENFDCGLNVLNDYLKKRANQDQRRKLSIAYVAVPKKSNNQKHNVMAYYTLSNSCIVPDSVQQFSARQIPSTYTIPTIKIGRFAVDKKYQRSGFGNYLLQDAFLRTLNLSQQTGINGIEIDAKNDKLVQYYQRFGFTPVRKDSCQLFLPLAVLTACESVVH